MDLTMLADFNLVAAQGGFAKASRASGRSKATLSRNVKRLEDDLGVRLIERSSTAFQLTEDGRSLFERSEGLLAEVQEIGLEMKGRGPEPRGVLRISAPLVFSQVFLGTLAVEFKAAYPLVRLEATVEDRFVDLVDEGYDAVVRVNPDRRSPLVGRCFLRDFYVVAASPSLVLPAPGDHPVDAVVLTHRKQRKSWRVRLGDAQRDIVYEATLRLPSLLMVRDAIRVGAGAAALPMSVVKNDIAAGRLVSWGEIVGGAVELWVLHTSRRPTSSKILAFVKFVCDRFAPNEPGA